MGKTSIYCCYHKPIQKTQYPNEDVIWIYGPSHQLNGYFNELTMFKYIYETDKDSQYIGCCHYRRQFHLKDIDYDYLDDDHCITLNRRINPEQCTDRYGSIRWWSNPKWQDCEFLYFDFLDYIRTKDDYLKYYHADEFCYEHQCFYARNCFIMNRFHFFKLCEHIGGFYDYIDKKYELNHDHRKYYDFLKNYKNTCGKITEQGWFNNGAMRLFGYMGELLTSNYIVANFNLDNVKYLNDNIV